MMDDKTKTGDAMKSSDTMKKAGDGMKDGMQKDDRRRTTMKKDGKARCRAIGRWRRSSSRALAHLARHRCAERIVARVRLGARAGRASGRVGAGRGRERWINSEPLTTPGLRGRVVLVEFWTFG
jgi:hypothetical protein